MYRNNTELYHHGVKGMKWGVRKSEYKTMTRHQRREIRKAYLETPEGKKKMKKAAAAGAIIATTTALASIAALSVDELKYRSDKKKIDAGEREMERLWAGYSF